jgi:hypothetical protein
MNFAQQKTGIANVTAAAIHCFPFGTHTEESLRQGLRDGFLAVPKGVRITPGHLLGPIIESACVYRPTHVPCAQA